MARQPGVRLWEKITPMQRVQRCRLVGHSAVISVMVALAVTVVSGCRPSIASSRPSAGRYRSSKAAALSRSRPRQAHLAEISLGLKPFITGLTEPTQLTYAPDGSGRVYITEQPGLIRVADASGRLYPQPFLDIRSLVLAGGERGLLSVAFHPDYVRNGFFFITYTNRVGSTVLARYHVSEDSLRADPTSATSLLVIPQLGGEHKSGQLMFGPDGYLYMSVGDGALGAGGVNGQNLDTVLGKIIRLDVDHTSPGRAYAIPPTNPFVGDAHARGEIWDYGLRNAWRFSFDQSTGDLYIGAVGGSLFESIYFQPHASRGGANFGWDVYEGNLCEQADCSLSHFVRPVATYSHHGGLCAVMGGYVYRGARYPTLDGIYLYADYCTGRIFGLVAAEAVPGQPSTTRQVGSLNSPVSAFGEDASGEVYVLGYQSGVAYHVTNV
jgi:glucose/arabinose dehydrogenase